jgi:RNA polymerase sigma factor (sigma-70 family)
MAAEPRTKPVDLTPGENCPLSGALEPSSNGRPACAPKVAISRTECQSALQPIGGKFAAGDKCPGGDPNWLNVVIERFEGPLVRYATRITGDLERGRDVVQETFLRLCREPALATADHLGQWLFTACRRLAIDVHRKETRMRTQLDGAAVCEVPARPESAESMERRENLGQVLHLLGRLPSNQQEVVRLKFQEGMSYKEIAEITGLSVGNVGYLLHTAVKALRAKVNTNK